MATNERNVRAMAKPKSVQADNSNNNIINTASTVGNPIQSLTQCLEQIASLSQTNPQQFECQKKEFLEQLSSVFGSLPNNAYVQDNNKQSVVPSILSQGNLVSVPLSIISNSNASHASSLQNYQYPYLTSGPNPLTNVPSLQNSQSYSYSNPLQTSHNMISPASINSINSPLPSQSTPNDMTAYESYWMRRILSNILLLLFRYHPNGVLECELSGFYEAMFNGEKLALTMDLKYLLCVHKSITITTTKERGKLYTLNDSQMGSFLQEFDSSILQTWITKHIRRLFRCFPNGIAVDCLQDLLYNMVEFKLAAIVGSNWQQFVQSIEHMYCIDVGGIATLIYVELEDLSGLNSPLNLSQLLNPKNVLTRPVGYCELLIVLLAQHCSTTNGIGIDGETLEKAFHEQYQSRLVHEAPFIADVLSKICVNNNINTNNSVNSDKNHQLFKLTPSSQTYFDTQPEAFAPILKRNLTLVNNNNNNIKRNEQQTRNVNVVSVNAQTSNAQTQQSINTNVQTNNVNNNGNNNGKNEGNDEGVLKSPFQEDHVSVFMGGFGHGTSVEDLRLELQKMGICMISSSGISYRNYGWSFVTLVNAQQADFLVKRSPIQIGGRSIDVRPFINRQRVKNHIENKPTKEAMLNAMVELLNEFNEGLTVSNVQSRLFRKFSYRIDGPELTKLIGDHPTKMYIRRHGTERIRLTPSYSMESWKEFASKIEKLWSIISHNYRGNLYANFDAKTTTTATATATATTVTDNESKLGNNNNNKDGDDDSKQEYVISVIDLENEFARKYKCAINAQKVGFTNTKELMQEMQKRFNFGFEIINHFHSRSQSREHEHFRNKRYYNNKHQYGGYNNNNNNNKYHNNNNNNNANSNNNHNGINNNGNSNNVNNVNNVNLNRNGNQNNMNMAVNNAMNNQNISNLSLNMNANNVYNNLNKANAMMANQYMNGTTTNTTSAATTAQYPTLTSPNPLLTYQQYMSAATNPVSPYNYFLNATANSVGNYSYVPSVPNSIISNQNSVSNNGINGNNSYLNINAFAVSYNNNNNKQKI